MVTSKRTRPRHNHRRTQTDTSLSSKYDRLKDDSSSVPSKYLSRSAKQRHKSSTHVAFEQESVSSTLPSESSSTFGIVDLDRTNEYDNEIDRQEQKKKKGSYGFRAFRTMKNLCGSPKKMGISIFVCALITLILVMETATSSGDHSDIKTHLDNFLNVWVGGVANHPVRALCMYTGLYVIVLLFLLPGTPLTVGGGFVFSKAFGLKMGIILITGAVLISTTIGYVTAFCLGRYFLHAEIKQKMLKQYPMFAAFDEAISENTFRIISLLHLTPIIPFGPVSYMSGGLTSMPLLSFSLANVASLPLLILYVFVGASAGVLFSSEKEHQSTGKEKDTQSEDEIPFWLVLLGMLMSLLSIGIISHLVKKELRKVFEKQERLKAESKESCQDSVSSIPELHNESIKSDDVDTDVFRI